MHEKKVLYKTNGAQKKRTVESYYFPCNCAWPDCNPCGSVPSDAYVAQKNSRHTRNYYQNSDRMVIFWACL